MTTFLSPSIGPTATAMNSLDSPCFNRAYSFESNKPNIAGSSGSTVTSYASGPTLVTTYMTPRLSPLGSILHGTTDNSAIFSADLSDILMDKTLTRIAKADMMTAHQAGSCIHPIPISSHEGENMRTYINDSLKGAER